VAIEMMVVRTQKDVAAKLLLRPSFADFFHSNGLLYRPNRHAWNVLEGSFEGNAEIGHIVFKK